MNLASNSAAIMCNSIDSGHPWRTLWIRVKWSDRKPFILILDWMLVNTTLITWINFCPYPNFCKPESKKSHSSLSKVLIQFILHIDYVKNSRKWAKVNNSRNHAYLVSYFLWMFKSKKMNKRIYIYIYKIYIYIYIDRYGYIYIDIDR